jgi:hypothetical protein
LPLLQIKPLGCAIFQRTCFASLWDERGKEKIGNATEMPPNEEPRYAFYAHKGLVRWKSLGGSVSAELLCGGF